MKSNDLQELINHSHRMAEELLVHQDGEFYPFGFKVDHYGKLINVSHYDGDEFPLSENIIEKLRACFEQEIADGEIIAYAITFDCLAKKDLESEKTDTIAIECYLIENHQRTTYYFPYKLLLDKKLEFGKPWGVTTK